MKRRKERGKLGKMNAISALAIKEDKKSCAWQKKVMTHASSST